MEFGHSLDHFTNQPLVMDCWLSYKELQKHRVIDFSTSCMAGVITDFPKNLEYCSGGGDRGGNSII